MKITKWLQEGRNLRFVEVGTTITFVFIFIFYFYGFRTGFKITPNDIWDIIMDIIIIWISNTLIIRTFSRLAMFITLEEDVNILSLEEKHTQEIDKVNYDTLGQNLKTWNENKIKAKMHEEKTKRINELKRLRGELKNKDKPKERKIKRIDKRIKHLEDKDTNIKVKHHWVRETELLTKGDDARRKKEVSTNYSVVKDVTVSQSSSVVGSIILIVVLRFAVDPTLDNMKRLAIFLSIIIPMLISRSITSYLISMYKTKFVYKYAVEEKIRILQWCNKQKIEGNEYAKS